MNTAELIDAAVKARNSAYSPYSGITVGAAVRSSDGTVYTGANVENASYGLTICAERNAVFSAVSDGATKLISVAIATEDALSPCGACLQVLAEFASPQLDVHLLDAQGTRVMTTLGDLLPHPPSIPKAASDEPEQA